MELLTTKNLFKMKNFIAKKKSPLPLPLALLSAALLSLQACDETSQPLISPEAPSATLELTPYSVARTLSGVPFTIDQVREVWDGVNASSANGYDEEYTFSDMFSSPGRGVGDELSGTRSSGVYPEPFSKLIASRLGESVASSDLRIYWPYSEDWDGVSMQLPVYLDAVCSGLQKQGRSVHPAGILYFSLTPTFDTSIAGTPSVHEFGLRLSL